MFHRFGIVCKGDRSFIWDRLKDCKMESYKSKKVARVKMRELNKGYHKEISCKRFLGDWFKMVVAKRKKVFSN